MRNYFNFLATAYCASEFSLAEQRCNFVSENAYTESIAKRAKFLASELATFIENHGYQIILYAQNEPGGKTRNFIIYKPASISSWGSVFRY